MDTRVRLHRLFLLAYHASPFNQEGAKERLRYKCELDECKGFLASAKCGPTSCVLFFEWAPTRAIMKSALQELVLSRQLQVTLASILVGTRFKFFAHA